MAASLNINNTLTTLIPPPVEPADAPIKLAKISNTGNAIPHNEKLVEAKPVVVAMETLWKIPYLNASLKLAYCPVLSK